MSEPSVPLVPTDEVVLSLVHDLRQPLSAIEGIAYYLDLRLDPAQTEIREYVSKLQVLVANANDCLTAALAASARAASV